jgi:Flp pilus assembly protein TadB
MSEQETEAPPAGEQIHMPEPSILPLLNAVGLAGVIISITLSVVLVVLFGILFLVTTAVWIRSAARDVNELPAEH